MVGGSGPGFSLPCSVIRPMIVPLWHVSGHEAASSSAWVPNVVEKSLATYAPGIKLSPKHNSVKAALAVGRSVSATAILIEMVY